MGSKERLVGFSDGVFAVAITLLVLDIRLPAEIAHGELSDALTSSALGLQYLAYAISFLTIGVMWVNHHRMLSIVTAPDHGLLYRNVLLLAVVSFIPFPTSVLAEYVHGHGRADEQSAVGAYGLSMVALGIAFTLLWAHLQRHPEVLGDGYSPKHLRKELLQSAAGTSAFAVATALDTVSPAVTLVMVTALVMGFALARPPRSYDDVVATP